jgi:nicotinamide-nucleotide adenylyltransferase
MKKRFKLGLFVGRFQPFHKGHLYALRFAKARCEVVVIGIGSVQETGTEKNPLSAKERIRIIRSGLKGAAIDPKGYRFLKVPDFLDDDKWFDYIIRAEPGIDVVFSRNTIVKRIFRNHSITVLLPPWHNRRRLAATRIRALIKGERNWRDAVPSGSIKEIQAQEERIKRAVSQISRIKAKR